MQKCNQFSVEIITYKHNGKYTDQYKLIVTVSHRIGERPWRSIQPTF